MLECYHITCIPLQKGSIIEAGNWGRIVKLYDYPLHQIAGNVLSKELILEATRRDIAPNKPSRLEAAFCCPTLDHIKHFKAANNRNTEIIYKVSIRNDYPTHYGNWNHVTPQNGNMFFSTMIKLANEYWTEDWEHQHIETPEIVTLSPLTVIERIE